MAEKGLTGSHLLLQKTLLYNQFKHYMEEASSTDRTGECYTLAFGRDVYPILDIVSRCYQCATRGGLTEDDLDEENEFQISMEGSSRPSIKKQTGEVKEQRVGQASHHQLRNAVYKIQEELLDEVVGLPTVSFLEKYSDKPSDDSPSNKEPPFSLYTANLYTHYQASESSRRLAKLLREPLGVPGQVDRSTASPKRAIKGSPEGDKVLSLLHHLWSRTSSRPEDAKAAAAHHQSVSAYLKRFGWLCDRKTFDTRTGSGVKWSSLSEAERVREEMQQVSKTRKAFSRKRNRQDHGDSEN